MVQRLSPDAITCVRWPAAGAADEIVGAAGAGAAIAGRGPSMSSPVVIGAVPEGCVVEESCAAGGSAGADGAASIGTAESIIAGCASVTTSGVLELAVLRSIS